MKRQAVAKDGPLRDSPRLLIDIDGDGWPLEVVWHVGFGQTDSYLYRLVAPVEPEAPPVYEFVKALGAKERGTQTVASSGRGENHGRGASSPTPPGRSSRRRP